MSISVFRSLVVCLWSVKSEIYTPRYLCGVLGLDAVISFVPNLTIVEDGVGTCGLLWFCFLMTRSSVFCGLISISCVLKKLLAMSSIFSALVLELAIQIVLSTTSGKN